MKHHVMVMRKCGSTVMLLIKRLKRLSTETSPEVVRQTGEC